MESLRRFPALAAAAAFSVLAVGTAGGRYAGGGLTILSRNNLDGAVNDGSAAILVNQPGPFDAGYDSCKLLGEAPWSPETADFKTALSYSLAYQEYQGIAPKRQLYWIARAKSGDASCRAIEASGKTYHVDCRKKLPTLCTQGAPISTSSSDNTSAAWQVQQYVGKKLLTGYRDYHVWKFMGIRYADTPERFTYSKVASFEDSGEADATTTGADCAQPDWIIQGGRSEDCLFANVWTPYIPRLGDKMSKMKPVMLWIYGGAWMWGSGKIPYTDGTNLASRGDVVVVSINYRLGSLGFLNFNDGVHNGNYGISDMISALEWVNKCIKYFGGDPDNVTVFGESSGAGSIHALLGDPRAKGLFHRAVMQSAPEGATAISKPGKLFSYPYFDDPEHNYEATTKKVLSQAACLNATDPIACLSKLSGFELVTLPTNANAIIMDGTYITNHEVVVNSTAGSLSTAIPVLMGINRDETGLWFDPSL
ncbi:hypothetical protein VTI74DRAFT_1639 [Chaetomium olivicolor]